MSEVRVRFAPSPTGLLHAGNARVAIINWLMASASGGEMLLRIDDTDPTRSHKKYKLIINTTLLGSGLYKDEFPNINYNLI